jgi:hypothetical protein
MARVRVPKGIYTHLVFCAGPHQDAHMPPATQLEQPVVFDRPGFIDIDPINQRRNGMPWQ